MKIRYIQYLLVPAVMVMFPAMVYANSYCDPPLTGNFNVNPTLSCSITNSVDGAQAGNIIIYKDKSLSVTFGQTLVWAPGYSIIINGSLNIVGGTIKQGTLYYPDADGDGFPDETTTKYFTKGSVPAGNSSIQKVVTTEGLSGAQLSSPPLLDCNTGNPNINNHYDCYHDYDQDGAFSTTTVNVCESACNGPYYSASVGTDCNDASASASPLASQVKFPHASCYADLDADGYTNGVQANTTCLSAATCATSRYAGLAGDGNAVTDYTTTGYLKDAANGSDCNDKLSGYQNTLSATYYDDADVDTYTSSSVQNAGGCVCSSQNTWDTSNGCSVSGNLSGTPFAVGSRRAAANGTDCNDGNSAVYLSHAQCYADLDLDNYTNGLQANTTCLNSASCNTATKASASSNGAAVTTYTAGQIKDAAGNTGDICDSDNKSYPTEATYYTSQDACAGTGQCLGWDYNCNNNPNEYAYPSVGSKTTCTPNAGSCNLVSSGSIGWKTSVAACGVNTTWISAAGTCASGPYPGCVPTDYTETTQTQACK